MTVLHKRYLADGESPDDMLDRVADGDQEIRELMAELKFLPNSPTLMNAGRQGTLSACFKFDVPDTMEGIMDTLKKAALVLKWGGGVGYAFSAVRAKGEPINSTGGEAMGPVELIRWAQTIAHPIKQGGKRPGAQMAILSCEHPDIREFVHLKDEEPERWNTFNISVAATDRFMTAALEDPWCDEGRLFSEIVYSAWATGDPGFYFIDAAERQNPTPHFGELTGTNPCGEVPLLDNEPCNLGSINLANVPADELWQITKVAIRFLDRIIDRNWFPVPEIERANLRTRKLGLGVMGWADYLAYEHIPYASDVALNVASGIAKTLRAAADDQSQGRNATVMSIAPTGTISILAGCSSGIEPHFANQWDRRMADGTILKEKIYTNGFKPATAMDISPKWHIAHQAEWQRSADLAVSKTINLPSNATPMDVAGAYIRMWQQGCKGGTVYRDGCREQVLTTTQATCPDDGTVLMERDNCSVCPVCEWSICNI